MNRRKLIEMTPEAREAFLHDARTIVLSTIDARGYPHSVAMWYVVEDGCVLMTTYAKSQKALNLERNPKVALMVESGTSYDTLQGILIRGRAELIRDVGRCAALLMRIHAKMLGAMPVGVEEAMQAQARKRVIIRVQPERVSSWDHRKLAGAY